MKINHSYIKSLWAIAVTAVVLFTSLHTSAQSPTDEMLQPGVSRQLALWRKASIADVNYQLNFDLPINTSEPVNGSEQIAFTVATSLPIVLDFKADDSRLRTVAINGAAIDNYRFSNQHIVIPASDVNPGRNVIDIDFVAGDRSLNRNDGYLYTLLVPDRARTLFPCFDQPDIKAEYRLTLTMPDGWCAVSNTSIAFEHQINDGRKKVTFNATEPLSTYLFSFVAGEFSKTTRSDGKHTISAYYRETAPDKVAQLDTVFKQIFASLDWLEDFTAIPYPFAKYDFVVLPGFQFGGMEHTGATLYNDRMIFLGSVPTVDEELARSQIIAHETSHMWFGDYVTMDWFDDVWTKEVFANYFATCIAEPMYPDINHNLYRQRTFAATAMTEDRTRGTTAIQQPLDNLQDAGLIYNNIIYYKAPVVMFKLVNLMGWDSFKAGIREYLNRYAYSNANWDDLIDILDSFTDYDLKKFSSVWVKAKGMPTLEFTRTSGGFEVSQSDPYGRGFTWPQTFVVKAFNATDSASCEVDMNMPHKEISLPFTPDIVLPNTDGRGYGFFLPDAQSLRYIVDRWYEISDEAERQSLMMTMMECYLHGKLSAETVLNSLTAGVAKEQNKLIATTAIGYIGYIAGLVDGDLRRDAEYQLAHLSKTLQVASLRLTADRQLIALATERHIVCDIYDRWANHSADSWSNDDYTTAAYELAIRMPEKADSILAVQRSRILNDDELRKFDFISRACTSDTIALDNLFAQLKSAENRRIEPYAERLLYYLNHPLRADYSVKYIRPALELLQEVQLTGDIFFPAGWLKSLLKAHHSEAAKEAIENFLRDNPNYPELLRNKILQAAYLPEPFETKND